jgi:hypothetical protein
MKSAVDKLLYTNITEFNEQLLSLDEQNKTLSEDLKFTVKILIALGKEATEDQLQLLTDIKNNLKIHRVLLRDIASLVDYLPYPDLEHFAKQLKKNSFQLQGYLELYDKDPKAGRAPKLNKKGGAVKSTEQILAEQFDTSSLSRVIAGVQNLADGSYLSPQQQFNLAQQVIYINAIGKEFPLTMKQSSATDLTALSREELRVLSDELIKQVNNPVLGRNGRIKAQLNMVAVMREQYFRCTGVFLNTTQLLSILLSLNNLQHNGFVELAADRNQYDTKAILAAMQWVLNYEPNELLAKEFKYKGTKDFFAFIGVPAQDIETSLTEEAVNTGIVKPELVGLSKKTDVEVAYRVPFHKKSKQQELAERVATHSKEYLQRISIALNMAEPGQPVLLIAKDEQQAKELNERLARYLKSENTEAVIDVFTGAESEEKRHQWFKDNKLKQLKIAITIPELATNKEFNTHSSDGCLAIQIYMDEPVETKRIIDNVSSFGKGSHFVAIHEENGILSILSRSLTSDEDKKRIFESIGANKQNRAQERAIEQYYIQSVTTIQRVALSQFDEWQALLHLVFPRSEWKQLDKELLLVRQDFIKKMELNWTQLLVATDLEQAYPNPYIRRDANNKLDTVTLDKAVNNYAINTNTLWNSVRDMLKSKTTGKVSPDSVNALRCKYLEQADLQEHLVLEKLAIRDGVKNTQRDRKKASRLVKSALDVNGVMLKYAEGTVDLYRQSFMDHQLKLVAQDVCKQIRLSSLSSKTKKVLTERTLNADDLISLELVLIDYEDRWLRPDRNSDKYRMQPVINELLRIHQLAGIEADDQLLVLKNIYLDNAANDVVDDLEHALSWARNEKRGFGYFLERSAVQKAAVDILNIVDDVKYASDPMMRKAALKNLYSTLTRHQAQLEGMWIFSLGHKNTRDLINQTLHTLNDLTVIGSGKDELSIDFINECKEEAQSNLAKQKFNAVIKELETRNNPWLRNNTEWQEISVTLGDIQRENPSLYAIDEMHHFISLKCNELSQSKSKIIDPLIHLRGTLRSLWHDTTRQHKELLDESRHFELKKEQIRKDLEKIPGYEVSTIELLVGTNGSREYYDLIIKGNGALPLLDHFTRYNSQLSEVRHDRAVVDSQLELPRARHASWVKLINEQLSLINAGKWQQVNVGLFPQILTENTATILTLQSYVSGETPLQMDGLSPEVQNYFFDRAVIDSLDVDQFFNKKVVDSVDAQQMLDRINTMKDKGLRDELKELYYKIHPPVVEQTPSSWWSPKTWGSKIASGVYNVASSFVGVLIPTEAEEDWRYQFADLVNRPASQLTEEFAPQINERIKVLTAELERNKNIEADKIDVLNTQLKFLDAVIEEESSKSGAIIYRFDSIGQLYEFEKGLRPYAEKATPKVAAKAPEYGDSGEESFLRSDADEQIGFDEDEDEVDSDEDLVSSPFTP